jgi:beta-catenin-like protein 1
MLHWFVALGTADEDVFRDLANKEKDEELAAFYTVLLPLLNHPNTDIGNVVVTVLHELLYDEDGMVDLDLVEALIGIVDRSLTEAGLLDLFYAHLICLQALDNQADANDHQAVYQILQITESLAEMCHAIRDDAIIGLFYTKLHDSLLMSYLVDMLHQDPKSAKERSLSIWKTPGEYANRLFSAELTATLIQLSAGELNSEDKDVEAATGLLWKHLVNDVSIVEAVLISLSPYRERDPEDVDEQEYLFNLFDILGALLLNSKEARAMFAGEKCEGFELMLLMLKELNIGRIRAIQLVDYALAAGEGEIAMKFLKAGGIKLLAPILMGKGSSKLVKLYPKLLKSADQDESHACAVLASLLKFTPRASAAYFRLLAKFSENEGEKLKRLMELHSKYQQRVQQFDRVHIVEGKGDETAWLLDRMNAGLFTLQAIDSSILLLISFADALKAIKDGPEAGEIEDALFEAVRTEAEKQLVLPSAALAEVRQNISEMLASLDGQSSSVFGHLAQCIQ